MKPINLAKCKIGQRVRLRNGREATFKQRIKGKCIFPFAYQIDGALSTVWVNQHGSYLNSTEAHDFDIIALLPLPKKKAPPRLQKALKLPATLDKQAIKAAIKTLQALLK